MKSTNQLHRELQRERMMRKIIRPTLKFKFMSMVHRMVTK